MVGTCRPAANRRLHLVTPEPQREVELAVLVLATAVCARDRPDRVDTARVAALVAERVVNAGGCVVL
ncbi:MAG TPA: hypothetical protein VGW74_06295 [Propionibacteriaceae bacterium]|nr:hypothetical protein [Propionibacteriaceae bacterium]